METAELVVELGIEEIPASMLERAAREFAAAMTERLTSQRLAPEGPTVWFTPRRIVVGFERVPVRQPDLVETLQGPPVSVAFTAEGAPARAAEAFAAKHGVKLAHLTKVETKKGAYLALERTVRGLEARRILEGIVPEAIASIQFSKTMVWTEERFRFVRPLRWIVAILQGRPIRFSLAGIRASNSTAGHRFVGKGKIRVRSLAGLRQSLADNGVLVDPSERLSRIREGLETASREAGGRAKDDPELLQMVVNLNELPTVIRGRFDPAYLDLPAEILVTAMREHQKYFSLVDGYGNLLPGFLAVINLDADRQGLIRAGHERVLRARLADAAFFWETDRRTKLADREVALDKVLFQEKLGSYRDKTRRMLALAPRVAEAAGARDLADALETAVRLSKCDLVTEMVREFTDLQGVVGGLYARAEGYPEPVWRAVYEQYLPKSTTGPSPESRAGALLGLIDRLDTVVGCFRVGLVPTSSGDPLALRRQGTGILKIVLDHRLRLSLARLVDWSLQAHGGAAGDSATAGALVEFFGARLRFLFEERGVAYDSINATLAVGFDDPVDAAERVAAIEEMRGEADFLAVASSFKRVKNILAQSAGSRQPTDAALFLEPAERALGESFRGCLARVEECRGRGDYHGALRELAGMRQAVDRFFDEVLVMAPDPRVRANRLALLGDLGRLLSTVADISEIVVERAS